VNTAEQAQRLRKEILSWPDVHAVYGPQLGTPDPYYLRFQDHDGLSYSIELRKDSEA